MMAGTISYRQNVWVIGAGKFIDDNAIIAKQAIKLLPP